MAERDDEQLEALLRQFLSDELDGRLGRSERHFRQYLSAVAATAWRQRAWLIGAFISGMAASVAVLWAAPLLRHQQHPQAGESSSRANRAPMANVVPAAMEQFVQSRTTDEGIIMVGDAPVRVVHRQALERTRWLDAPGKVRAEQLTPRDDLMFIKLPTY